MLLDASFFNTHHYDVRIKGKWIDPLVLVIEWEAFALLAQFI